MDKEYSRFSGNKCDVNRVKFCTLACTVLLKNIFLPVTKLKTVYLILLFLKIVHYKNSLNHFTSGLLNSFMITYEPNILVSIMD